MRNNIVATIGCSAVAGMLVFGLAGCGKKEAAQDQASQESMPTEDVAPAPAAVPAVAGTYVAEMGEGDAASKMTLTMNDDNTAIMTIEHMNGQPAMSQSGTWAMGEGNTITFNYGAEGSMMSMPMTMDGDQLHVTGDMATAMGAPEISLVKQAAAEPMEEDPHAGHEH